MKAPIRSQKGVGEIYSETKKAVSVAITPTGLKGLDAIAEKLGVSRSELVERIGRGIIPLKLDDLQEFDLVERKSA